MVSPLVLHPARIFGAVLVVVGLFVAGYGLYQDTTAPACSGPIESPEDGQMSAGGCQEPGLSKLFGGASLAVLGALLVGVATFAP